MREKGANVFPFLASFLGGLGHIGSPNNLVSHLLGSPFQVKTQKVRGRLA